MPKYVALVGGNVPPGDTRFEPGDEVEVSEKVAKSWLPQGLIVEIADVPALQALNATGEPEPEPAPEPDPEPRGLVENLKSVFKSEDDD